MLELLDGSSEDSSGESFDNFRRFWGFSIDVPADRLDDLFCDCLDLKVTINFYKIDGSLRLVLI